MSVYDRWHKTRPGPGDEPCREHSRARTKLYPTADHGKGDRWQVRWRDDTGRQRKENFAKRSDADARDAQVRASLTKGIYVDDAAGKITFCAYAEQWRASRTHDPATAERIKSEFTHHVYADPSKPGKTLKGGPAIGHYQMRALAKQVSTMQAWISGIPLHPNSARQLIMDVSQVFTAAVDDGIIARNPLSARSVQRPKPLRREAVAWSRGQIESVVATLPAHVAAMAYLGAACGHRQGELFGAALNDIDFLRKMIRVEVQVKYLNRCMVFAPVKNRKARDVPVADPVIPILSEHVRLYPPVSVTLPWMTPDGKPVTRRLLFTRPDGKPHYRGSLNLHWARAWRAAGIPEAEQINGMHVLRHTAASVWLSAGLSLAKVAAYLGDTKEVVLATYAHFMPDDDDRAREIMNVFFTARDHGSCAPDVPSGVGDGVS
jgi:integrase